MDVKSAISTAKDYVRTLFADEHIGDLGLEEVDFDDAGQVWRITVGFTRPYFEQPPEFKPAYYGRFYKVVSINDKNNKVLSVKNREPYQ
jgi:hypothetical protein